MSRRFVLTLGCPDRIGIVARIATFLAELGGTIMEAAYHADEDSRWFFTRQSVDADSIGMELDELRRRFARVATELGPETDWHIADSAEPKDVVILVSKEGHCLHDLLGRIESGDYPARVRAVIGNHDTLRPMAESHGVPFHHVPFPAEPSERGPSFDEVASLVDDIDPQAIVLARFMQVLPDELCTRWAGRAINIHHSFLPSFVGARPYHQAHVRGVKLIGATCHYVTADLDEGPIIEQDVIRVNHTSTVKAMVRQGRDAEKLVLARGLRWHLEDRVLVHDGRTVVFT